MSKVLVAYFSASGVTKQLSERMARAIDADIFEIVPQEPYTKADLDWTDKNSRSTVEMEDRSCRPAIAGKVDDIGQYDVIFTAFPIWWYREPSIIDTFLDSYDLSGKTIVPVATSGGSGMGETSASMQSVAPAANVVEGKRFAIDAGEEELKEFASKWI